MVSRPAVADNRRPLRRAGGEVSLPERAC